MVLKLWSAASWRSYNGLGTWHMWVKIKFLRLLKIKYYLFLKIKCSKNNYKFVCYILSTNVICNIKYYIKIFIMITWDILKKKKNLVRGSALSKILLSGVWVLHKLNNRCCVIICIIMLLYVEEIFLYNCYLIFSRKSIYTYIHDSQQYFYQKSKIPTH